MLKVGLGQAEDINTRRATASVINQCRRQLQGHMPQAGILFAGIEFNHAAILDEINHCFPEIELIGCTTAGEFSSRYGFSDDSISLMVFYSDDVEFKAGVGRELSVDYESCVQSALRQASSSLSQPAVLCLALPDFSDKSFDPVLKLLNRKLGPNCPVFGGCAGTQWERYPLTKQFYNHDVLTDALPMLLMAGAIDYTFMVANSWKPVGKKALVTSAHGPKVMRIDDFTAVDFYRHYLGQHTQPASEFILAVYEKPETPFYLRAPIAYHAVGSITFSDSIPQGAIVQLTEAVREDIIADTKTSTATLAQSAIGFQPAFALAFSCVFRKEILGTHTKEELQTLKAGLPPGIPINGFYSFGEISPLQKGKDSFLHGATLVTLVAGLRNSQTAQIDQQPTPPAHGKQLPDDQCADLSLAPWHDESPAEQLKQENAFLKRKLARSQQNRRRMEAVKDFNGRLNRKIIQEVENARHEIQRQEAALRKSEAKYRRIVATTGEGFVLMDNKLAIIDANAAYCRMIGFTLEELLGKSPFDLASKDFKAFLTVYGKEIVSQEYREIEGVLMTKNKKPVPVLIHGNTLRDDDGNAIGHMAFVTDMTAHKKALALAGEVQKSLLPQDNPNIHGLDIAGKNISCDEIGGDYFDFLWGHATNNGPFSVIVGDIAGHGVDSALLMASARAFLRMRASQPGTISAVVSAMNRHMAQDAVETGRFMTLFYMTIDPEGDRIQWVRAGHDPALIYDPSRDHFEELKGPGLALGVDENFKYMENHKKGLASGQVIAIGTDGVWEACNQQGEMFGKNRFQAIIRQYSHHSADNILNAVFSALDQHMRGVKTGDDITLVVIKVGEHFKQRRPL